MRHPYPCVPFGKLQDVKIDHKIFTKQIKIKKETNFVSFFCQYSLSFCKYVSNCLEYNNI